MLGCTGGEISRYQLGALAACQLTESHHRLDLAVLVDAQHIKTIHGLVFAILLFNEGAVPPNESLHVIKLASCNCAISVYQSMLH